jgi:hypothetical protein
MWLKVGYSTHGGGRTTVAATRFGAAQDIVCYGQTFPAVTQAGRWNTAETVGRYTAKQGVRQSTAVRIV